MCDRDFKEHVKVCLRSAFSASGSKASEPPKRPQCVTSIYYARQQLRYGYGKIKCV